MVLSVKLQINVEQKPEEDRQAETKKITDNLFKLTNFKKKFSKLTIF